MKMLNCNIVTFVNILMFSQFSCYFARVQVPAIRCPEYFQYLSDGNNYFGKITIPNIVPGSTKVNVQLSQREKTVSNYYGRLSLYEDQQTTINRIYSQHTVIYRVDFPTQNVLPKLILIAVNDMVICSDNPYPPPSLTLRLMHVLSSADLGGSLVSYMIRQQVPQQLTMSNVLQTVQSFNNRQPQRKQRLPVNSARQGGASNTAQVENPSSIFTTTYAECGLESRVITPFIVGGELLSPKQFPWLAAIYVINGADRKFTCGGTLVSQRTVVTAAHCFIDVTGGVEVHLGHYDLQDYSENFEIRRVQQIIKHPEFKFTSLPDADIAVLHLSAPVSFSTSIRPICLWNEQNDVNSLIGQKSAVAGWGEDENREIQSKPKKANVQVVSSTECQGALQRNSVPITARSICVRGADGSVPCRGDSGGGLIVLRNGRWTLRGIISGGSANDHGCLSDLTFFCDLAQHRSWLYTKIL